MPLSLADATVAIASPGDAAGITEEVLSGCESVLGAGHCVSSTSESIVSKDSTYYAEVSWVDPDSLAVRIRLFRGRSASTEIFERQVAFLARDTRAQRQHAAGVVIAAGIISHLQLTGADTPPQAPTQPQATASPAPIDSTQRQSRVSNRAASAEYRPLSPGTRVDWGLDGGPLLASGMNSSQPQLGLGLRGWGRKSNLPWRALAAASFTEGPYETRVTTWTLHLSIAACIEQLRWFEPRLGVELARSEVSATTSSGSRSESAQLVRYGANVGGDFVLRLGVTLALLSSFEMAASVPAYDVWVAGERVGGATLLGWRAFLGLRLGQN